MLSRKAMMMGVSALAMMPGVSRAQTAKVTRQAALDAALLRSDTLAYQASKAGMLFGCAIGRDFFDDPNYQKLVARECSLVCATQISPGVTRRSQTAFNFRPGDKQVAFANANKLAVYAGYLVVHDQVPPWITPTTDRAVALAEMKQIVSTTVSHYAGQLDYWIVVNEAIAAKGLRSSTWLSAIGPDYIAEAFRAARQADPSAVLVINENTVETAKPGAYQKRSVLLDLVTSLVKDGVPIDGVGLQGHLPSDQKIDVQALDSFLNSIHQLGLKIMVTELDVFDAVLPADIGSRDAAIAQNYTDFLTPLLRHPIESISVWGLSDDRSWLNNKSNPSSLRRADGVPSRPTLFDQDLRRKPDYFAVRKALGAAATS